METAKTKQKKQKKPFHIKRGDLDLAGYKKDLQDRSPAHLFNRAVTSLRTSRQFHLYLLIQALAAAIGYGQLALCIGILWMCYVNTGKRAEGEKSAYSIFNENTEALYASILFAFDKSLYFGVGAWWGGPWWLSAMAAVCISTYGLLLHRALL